MRAHRSLTLALGGAAALTLVAAQPAFAAAITWISASDSAWSTATWSGGAPAAGDDVTFQGGTRSTYDLPATDFSSFRFTNAHTVANGGGGGIGLTSGMTVDPGAVARVEPLLVAPASQTWTVGAGGSLTLPSAVRVENASTLTLQVDGVVDVTSGNLDGMATACIVKTGAGVLRLASGGGGVGTCAGQPAGLNVAAGEVAIVGTPNLGGKDFAVTGGTFTGGTDTGAAVVRQLNLAAGVVSPGAASGAGRGTIQLWGTSAWTGGTYQVDWDAVANQADLVQGANQAISVSGTRLDIRLTGTPTAGQAVRIVGSDIGFTGQFSSPTGTALANGAEFTSNGQVYAIDYVASGASSGATLRWLRAEPVVTPPVAPPAAPAPALADTGLVAALPLGLAAVALLGAGAVLIARGRRTVRTR